MKSYVNEIWKLGILVIMVFSSAAIYAQSSALHVDGAGNVGIGTKAVTGYKLSVNGGMIAEEVKIITDVPQSDYVFDEGYKPAPLTEIEEYVKINKHLPGIPSAIDFKNNGYTVGAMDNMLLKHVEEIMLYLIALEKENKRLSAEIEILKTSKISDMDTSLK